MKKSIFLGMFGILLWSHQAGTQCLLGQCQNGKGVYVYEGGTRYSGSFQDGIPHGQGILKQTDGMIYQGDFVKGKKHGEGQMIFPSGDTYQGDFKQNSMEGNGRMVFKNGDTYEGTWHEGMPSGKGVYHFHDGNIYEGYFAEGQFCGEGRWTFNDGRYYQGEWQNNQRHGWGLLVEDGETVRMYYENGIWIKSDDTESVTALPDCLKETCHLIQGQYTYKDGSVYTGEFIHNQPSGLGICVYANGNRYEGGWENHAPHGYGKMTFASGKILEAEWVYGKPKRSESEHPRSKIASVQEKKPHSSAEVKAVKTSMNHKKTTVPPRKIYALIVGVASYLHMPSLKYTDDDAYQLYAFLKSPEGGALKDEQISLLIDDAATGEAIREELSSLASKTGENDILWVYLAGHGLEGSFLPGDFDGRQGQMPYDDILDMLKLSSAKHKLLVADACHSGSMLVSARSPWSEALSQFYSSFAEVDGGTAIMTSSKKQETSLEYSGLRQGVFSYYLIQGMKGGADVNGDKMITMEELKTYVIREVRLYTQNAQNPVISGDYNPEMPVAWVRGDLWE